MADALRTTWMHEQLDRWKAGEAAARDELLRATGIRLEVLAHRMLGDFPAVRRQADTCDVLQNAVLRLLRALETVRPNSVREFFGLAAVQIRRELLDLVRQVRRTASPVTLSPAGSTDSPSQAAHDPPAPSVSTDVERWSAFHQEVEQLPAEEREVVSLVFYHGWTQAEVAELFQVTERTVRRWWQSALLRLREKLQGNFDSIKGSLR